MKKLQNERQNDKTKTDIRDWKSADIKSTVTANNLSYGFGCNDGNDDEYVEQLRISDLTITHNDWKQQNKQPSSLLTTYECVFSALIFTEF